MLLNAVTSNDYCMRFLQPVGKQYVSINSGGLDDFAECNVFVDGMGVGNVAWPEHHGGRSAGIQPASLP